MSRVAYFKGLNQTGLDEAQSALITTLQGQYSTLSTAVSAKAEKSYVDNNLVLKADVTAVALKANSADVSSALSAKADASSVNDALALKADSSALVSEVATINASLSTVNSSLANKANSSEITTLNNSIGAVNVTLANKLDASVHTARVANELQFFDAFKEVVYLSNANNTAEFDYEGLGLGSASVAP
jgi:hypothetical protein